MIDLHYKNRTGSEDSLMV